MNDKAKKMAADIRHSIKCDLHETMHDPQAFLTCLAGHLADRALTTLGQEMAHNVPTILQGMRRNQAPATMLHMAAAALHWAACAA